MLDDLKKDLDNLQEEINLVVNKYDINHLDVYIDKLYNDSKVTLRISRR